MMFVPSDRVKARIEEFLPKFKRWWEIQEAKDLLKERDGRVRAFRELLSAANI